jgi:hypothetical protein
LKWDKEINWLLKKPKNKKISQCCLWWKVINIHICIWIFRYIFIHILYMNTYIYTRKNVFWNKCLYMYVIDSKKISQCCLWWRVSHIVYIYEYSDMFLYIYCIWILTYIHVKNWFWIHMYIHIHVYYVWQENLAMLSMMKGITYSIYIYIYIWIFRYSFIHILYMNTYIYPRKNWVWIHMYMYIVDCKNIWLCCLS